MNLTPFFPFLYFDAETGLHYNYFRDYEPLSGRYVESDPIGLEGGASTYGYVYGRPLQFTDQLGLVACSCGSTDLGARVITGTSELGDKTCSVSCTCLCPQKGAPARRFSVSISVNLGNGADVTCRGYGFHIRTDSVFDRFLNPYTPTPDEQLRLEEEAKKQCSSCDYWSE